MGCLHSPGAENYAIKMGSASAISTAGTMCLKIKSQIKQIAALA